MVRIGYAPNSADLSHPADRRRFPYYARRRGIAFEIARPGERYDLVVLTPRADLRAWTRTARRPRLVVDVVDAYMELSPWSPKQALRGPAKFLAGEAATPFFSYRRALADALAAAHAVTCASPEQAAVLSRWARSVHPVLDFHGGLVRRVKQDYGAATPFRIVWEGLGENVEWFGEVAGALRRVRRERDVAVHLVTSIEFRQYVQRFRTRSTLRIARRHLDDPRLHQWSEDTLADLVTACDLAMIPLPLDRPFERSKPENKLVSFWRMGMPVLASATPAYARTMAAAGLDMACDGEDEWMRALLGQIDDAQAREQAGRRGRAFAEERHGEAAQAGAWDEALRAAGVDPEEASG